MVRKTQDSWLSGLANPFQISQVPWGPKQYAVTHRNSIATTPQTLKRTQIAHTLSMRRVNWENTWTNTTTPNPDDSLHAAKYVVPIAKDTKERNRAPARSCSFIRPPRSSIK